MNRMLNAVQYILAEEAYGESDIMKARRTVRTRLNNISQGLSMSGQAHSSLPMPVDQEQEMRKKYNIPADVPLLPPAPPPMVPQSGDNPFPHLEPPVG